MKSQSMVCSIVALALLLQGCAIPSNIQLPAIMATTVTNLPRNLELEAVVVAISAQAGVDLRIRVVEDAQRKLVAYSTTDKNGRRYIGIDPSQFKRLPWFGQLIALAHEVAHHLFSSEPDSTNDNYEEELRCDRWSGWVVARMGVTRTEALSVWELPVVRGGGSASHPASADRSREVGVGYNLSLAQQSARVRQIGERLSAAKAELARTRVELEGERDLRLATEEATNRIVERNEQLEASWIHWKDPRVSAVAASLSLTAGFLLGRAARRRGRRGSDSLDGIDCRKVFDRLFDPYDGQFGTAEVRAVLSSTLEFQRVERYHPSRLVEDFEWQLGRIEPETVAPLKVEVFAAAAVRALNRALLDALQKTA